MNLKYFHKGLGYFLPPKDLGLDLTNTVEVLVERNVIYMKSIGRQTEKHYVYHF